MRNCHCATDEKPRAIRCSPPFGGVYRNRDGLYDDLNPRPEHAEAVVQWQSRALRLMWEAAFGRALWHSGDSAVGGR